MVSNNSKGIVHHLATKYPGWIGHLYSPESWRTPIQWIPYALDNGGYTSFARGQAFDSTAYRKLLERARFAPYRPLWALVPDVVGDRDGTLRAWDEWMPEVRSYGWPLAFAVQDGMTPGDVPAGASIVFVGGSTEWKRSTFRDWAARGRCHVGRINTMEWLHKCADAGVESVDGTGWYHDRQMAQLIAFCRDGESRPRQESML